MIIVDSGPVIAMCNGNDKWHEACANLLESAKGPLCLAQPLLAEIGYMLARSAGPKVEADFLNDVADGLYQLVALTPEDVRRSAELVAKYADFPLGTSDACVIAIAERLQVRKIATLDRRHFSAVRPNHVQAFELLP